MNESDATGVQPGDEPTERPRPSVLDDMAMGAEAVRIPAEPDLSTATGHAVVDDVVRSLRDLDEQPVAEHVQVFERAHDSLRRALSDAGEPGAGQPERG